MILDTDDLTAALLERHHRITLLENELNNLVARVSAAERALNINAVVAASDAAAAAGPAQIAAPPPVESAKAINAVALPSRSAPFQAPLPWWKVLLIAMGALALAGVALRSFRRYLRARDESFRIVPQQADDYVAEVLAQSPKPRVRRPDVADITVKPAETRMLPMETAVAEPAAPEIHFELPLPSSTLHTVTFDKPGAGFDLSIPAANPESALPADDIRGRRMRYLQSRYQDIAILKPPLDAPQRLLSQAGRIHDEGAAEFAKRLLKFAVYSRPHTEEFWLALLELLYREKFANDFLVNAKWFRQYHPQSTNWEEVQRIGYLLDPAEPIFASAAAWSHEEPAVGSWLPATQPEEKPLIARSTLKLELAN
ncbi:MAG: hypothetical protein ABI790_17190 [Betaproteobacteria bacterium]